ncbi:hypothetical protein TNCV_1860661 [Trichonephila clavipes]|nr:hypothetical protein TNCV_1860661 [Trichonephila clavipes]
MADYACALLPPQRQSRYLIATPRLRICATYEFGEGKRTLEDLLEGVSNGEYPPQENESVRLPHGSCAEGHQVSSVAKQTVQGDALPPQRQGSPKRSSTQD